MHEKDGECSVVVDGHGYGSRAMTRRAGSYFVVGYGGTVPAAVRDGISAEGTCMCTGNKLTKPASLAQAGKIALHRPRRPLATAPDAIARLTAGRAHGRAALAL